MDVLQFQNLCRNASVQLGAKNPEELAEVGQISIGDIEVGLIFDDEHTDRLFCYVDIGSLEALDSSGDCGPVYRDMLTLNLLRGSKTAGVIALDPVSNHLLLSSHLMDPDSYDGPRLAAALQDHASDSILARELWIARLEMRGTKMPAHQIVNLA
ncbi:CesT family type III secretion system chaperone [Variovorax paradoxus]|nr:CesT family type III secretion system chaperone [Variovorax paradoxus]